MRLLDSGMCSTKHDPTRYLPFVVVVVVVVVIIVVAVVVVFVVVVDISKVVQAHFWLVPKGHDNLNK